MRTDKRHAPPYFALLTSLSPLAPYSLLAPLSAHGFSPLLPYSLTRSPFLPPPALHSLPPLLPPPSHHLLHSLLPHVLYSFLPLSPNHLLSSSFSRHSLLPVFSVPCYSVLSSESFLPSLSHSFPFLPPCNSLLDSTLTPCLSNSPLPVFLHPPTSSANS